MERSFDIRTTAHLAKLELSKTELADFDKDMKAIVSFAKAVANAPSPGISSPLAARSPLREDSPSAFGERDELLGTSPAGSTDDGYFSVGRVVE